MRGKSGGSLTFPENPLASMQELSALDAPAPRVDRISIDSEEIMKEKSNEGNFITSEFTSHETSEEDTQETVQETPPETIKQTTSKTRQEGNSKVLDQPKKTSPKLSLKEAVLEEGKAQEERITKTRLNVDIDEDLHIWLKGHAIQNRRKLNDLIPRILKAYRDQVEGD